MAGHSKWSNIRFRKGAQDAKRSKIFTKHIRELTVLSRVGGADPASNHRLRDAITRALKANMKKDTIEKAIARGAGVGSEKFFEVLYEGYGPFGVAILVECMTDNKNRTVAEIRHSFAKHGGGLGTDGSVAYLFEKVGVLHFPIDDSQEALFEAAIDAGAQDVETQDGQVEVSVESTRLKEVSEQLALRGFQAQSLDLIMRPQTEVVLDGDKADRVITLLDALDELDDVQQVSTNAAFDSSE